MKASRFFCLLFLCIAPSVHGQRIGGVYFGEIISEKNALVIRESEAGLTGLCYLDRTNKLNFTGTYIDEQLKGVIQLKDGEVVVEGHLENGSLKLTYMLYEQGKTTSLVKFSSNDRYKISNVFSDNHDPMLVGKWETVKHLDKNGKDVTDGKAVLEFEAGGRQTLQATTISSKFAGKMPPGFDPHKKVELTWYTEGPKLYTSVNGLSRQLTSAVIYTITKDTLVFYGENFTTFHKRQ